MAEVLAQMHMQVRRECFLRCHPPKLTSFRLPQETTRQLLRHQPQVDNVNDEEEHEQEQEEDQDDETCSTCSCTSSSASASSASVVVTATLLTHTPSGSGSGTTNQHHHHQQQQQQQPLNRRKRALARTPTQRMTSFRLPKDTTHRLLMEHPLEAFKEDDDEDADHTKAEHTATKNNQEKQQAKSFLLSKRKSLIKHERHTMTSFRLPKETTPHLLHFDVEQDDPSPERSAPVKRRVLSVGSSPALLPELFTCTTPNHTKEADNNNNDDDDDEEEEEEIAQHKNENNSEKTRMPKELVRQTSFSARTA